MKNPARLYQYAISFLSLEAGLWGLVALARLWFAGRIASDPDRLAQALSLIVVGGLVFGLHWALIQRAQRQAPDEAARDVRASFLFVTLLALLLPAAQNGLALVNRAGLLLFSAAPSRALVGSGQTWGGNLVALALNLLAAGWLWRASRAAGLTLAVRPNLQQAFLWIWRLYALVLSLLGSQLVLESVLQAGRATPGSRFRLVNGLALALFGLPLLMWVERWFQRQAAQPAPAGWRRLVALAGLAFLALAAALAAAGLGLEAVFYSLFSGEIRLPAWLLTSSAPFAAALPLAATAAYYTRHLRRLQVGHAEARFVRLARANLYALAAAGITAVVFGGQSLLAAGVAAQFGGTPPAFLPVRWAAEGLAVLVIGLPVWALAWLRAERQARQTDEAGDRARRSLFRRGYLYAALFAGAAGTAMSAGGLLYRLLSLALAGAERPPSIDLWMAGRLVLVFGVLLAYHGWVLRRDGHMTARKLAARHAQFPVLVLAPGPANGAGPEKFSTEELAQARAYVEAVVAALQQQAPSLPVAVHPYRLGVPDDTLAAARAVIVPAELLARPTEGWRLWLQTYSGWRLVIPTPAQNWRWVLAGEPSLGRLAQRAAVLVRRMAEGDEPQA